MIPKYFFHVLLLLAMLVGQMATNAHMINHMAVEFTDHDLSAHHSDHHHGDLDLHSANSDNSKSDCSIYHAYAGVYGITQALNNAKSVQFRCVVFKLPLSTTIIAQTLLAHPIRGPPIYS